MEYSIKKAAMTGGSGPIGLALIKLLLSNNIEVLLFQRKHSAKRMYLPESPLLKVEYFSMEELDKYSPDETDYDVFFHLGWLSTRKNARDNMEEQVKNVVCACEAVKMAKKLGCHTFLGTGSQAEYGRHEEALREDTLCKPETAYGVMKLSACHATGVLCRQYGMRHLWPRILSGYGLYDNIASVLISAVLDSMEGKKLVFSKGEQIWDFVYLDDIAKALLLIAQKGKDGSKYPIASGESRPLREYLEILCRKLGKENEVEYGVIPYSENQIMHLSADISSLQADTGWKPEVDFETGIERVIEFYKEWKPVYETRYKELRMEVEGY